MERIRELRKEQGLTMKELGALIGVSESTVSTYELGLHEPSCDVLCKIADILNTSTDYLLCRCDVAHAKTSPKLSEDERSLVKTFRSLNTQGRHALLSTAAIIAGNPDMQKEPYVSAEIS